LLNWSIKHKCLALFRNSLFMNQISPLWSAERGILNTWLIVLTF
jgi:hypothetical protein